MLVYYDTVWVEALPQFDSPFELPATACSQEALTVTYTGSAPDTAIYNWDFGTATVLSGTGPGPYEIVHNSMGNNAISLWVEGDGCTSDTTFHELAVGESPLVTVSADATILPYGDATILHGSYTGGIGPFEYEWSSNPPGFSSNLPVVTVEPLTTTLYTITIFDGLSTISESIAITVHPNPTANAGADQLIAYGTNTTLQGSGSTGSGSYSYHWEPESLLVNPDLAATQTVNLEASTVFYLTVTDLVTGCISVADELLVQLEGGPLAVTIVSSQPSLCEGNEVSLTAYPSGGNQGNYTYTWSDNLGNSYPSTQEILVSPDITLIYIVTVYDGFIEVEGFFELIVYPGAEFTWSGGLDVIHACPSDSVIINPNPRPAEWEYLWSNGSVEDHITVGTTGIGFSVNNYTLSTTSPNGCTFSKEVQVIFDFAYGFGISENDQAGDVKIIPNPNNGRFKVEMTGKGDYSLLSVYSCFAGKVFELSLPGIYEELEIDLGNLPEGIYLIILHGATEKVYKRFLISR